jgi:hypothetical protein
MMFFLSISFCYARFNNNIPRILKRSIIIAVSFGLILLLAGGGCSRQNSAPKNSNSTAEKGLAHKGAPKEKSSFKQKAQSQLLPQKMPKAKDRLLEYRVNYTIKCDDLSLARSRVLRFAQDYGFLAHISIERETTDPSLSARVYVERPLMYQAMQKVADFGRITKESLSVRDHTQSMKWQQIQAEMAQRQWGRRQKGGSKGDWQGEKMLSEAESTRAQARYKKWQIKDKINWVLMKFRLEGPKGIRPIETPSFADALNRALEVLLYTLYLLLMLSPLVLIGLGLFGLIRWFKKRKAGKT